MIAKSDGQAQSKHKRGVGNPATARKATFPDQAQGKPKTLEPVPTNQPINPCPITGRKQRKNSRAL